MMDHGQRLPVLDVVDAEGEGKPFGQLPEALELLGVLVNDTVVLLL
jgi:hypothetical protein